MKSLLKGLCLICLAFTVNANDDEFASKVSEAIFYLQDHTIDELYENIDLARSKQAVEYISLFLERRSDVSLASALYLKNIRGQALIEINGKRNHLKEEADIPAVNLAEVETALSDLEAVLANQDEPDSALYRPMAFAAEYLLNDEKRSAGYYERCARLNNIACMNVLGHRALYGLKGVSQDIKKGINLSKATYNTGTKWGCAGYYSATILVDIAYFTPYETGNSWHTWYQQAHALLPKLQKRFNKDLPCASVYGLTQEYLMYLGYGQKKPELLTQALTLEPTDTQEAFIAALQNTPDIQTPDDYFYHKTPDPVHCSLGLSLLMVAHLSKQADLIKIQQNNFTNLDEKICASTYFLAEEAGYLPEEQN